MTRMLLACAIGLLCGASALAQDAPPMKLKRYYLVLLYEGRNTAIEPDAARRLQEAHMANIGRLAREKSLVLAGPFEAAGDLRGLFVLDAPSLDAARALAASDPAVQAGRLRAEVFNWWAPEGVGIVPPAAPAK